MKFLSGFIIVALLGATLWVGFGLWIGLYSLYSIPPSKAEPEGVTMLISRESREPMFNAVDYKSPSANIPQEKGGIQFGSAPKSKKAVSERIILKLPFIRWAYEKSREPQKIY